MIKKEEEEEHLPKKTLKHLKIIKKDLTVAIMKTVSQPTQPKKNCVPVIAAV